MIRYISLFSGIECASLAAKPLGWQPVCFSEIEPFPSAVLAHHYPDVPNVGDVTAHDWTQYRGCCDLVIGGSPCQAFSVAGRRESLSDVRGNLTLSFAEVVNEIEPTFVVWENVPGVLSAKDNAFGCFLAALAGHDSPLYTPNGERWTDAGVVAGPRRILAWRVLDAQHFGVPQRRRRVFVVGCPVGGSDPDEILFEREGLRGDSSARREAGKDIAGTLKSGSRSGGWSNSVDHASAGYMQIAKCLTSKNQRIDLETETMVTHTLTRRYDSDEDGCGRGTPLVPVAFTQNQCGDVLSGDVFGSLGTNQNATRRNTAKVMDSGVRRLTPRECERLQGLPDDYTLIPWRRGMAPDGPRYKAIGNGMAVPCVRWIFERIEMEILK